MSWTDRPYAGDSDPQPELRIQFRRPSTAVTWLIVANVVIFFLDALLQRLTGVRVDRFLGLSLAGVQSLHLWQPLTYMFVHGTVLHLLANMLGLYIFGTEFERAFRRERFLQFYATCGLVGGLGYLAFTALMARYYTSTPLVGASGAVYGLLIAAIIYFPHIRVVLVIFPMPIRVFGLIVLGVLLLTILSGGASNLGGEVCHFFGAISGVGLFYAWGMMPRFRVGFGKGITVLPGSADLSSRASQGAWARKQRQIAQEQEEVDRILSKVSVHGMQSLTWRERKTLKNATRRERERDQELRHIDRW